MNTYNSSKSLCALFEMHHYEVPELSDQHLQFLIETRAEWQYGPLPGFKHTDEWKANKSEQSKLYRHSAESKAKIAAAHKGKKRDAKTVANMRIRMTGKKLSAETRAKMTEAQKRRWAKHREDQL